MIGPTTGDLRKALHTRGWGYAIEMVDAMDARATSDELYAIELALWLRNGDTVTLRDVLCAPFKGFSFIKIASTRLPMPWDNMWEAIDSAGISIR